MDLVTETLPKMSRNSTVLAPVVEWAHAVVAKHDEQTYRYPEAVKLNTVQAIDKHPAFATALHCVGRSKNVAGEEAGKGNVWLYAVGTWSEEGAQLSAERAAHQAARKPRTTKPKAAAATKPAAKK